MARWTGTSADTLPLVAPAVAKEVKYLPLDLLLAGAQVRDGQSWDHLLEALRAGRLDFLDHPCGSMFSSIKASVEAWASGGAERYVNFVFLEGVPGVCRGDLWLATGEMEEFDALLFENPNRTYVPVWSIQIVMVCYRAAIADQLFWPPI